jgi:hypothetical protein
MVRGSRFAVRSSQFTVHGSQLRDLLNNALSNDAKDCICLAIACKLAIKGDLQAQDWPGARDPSPQILSYRTSLHRDRS